MDKTIEQVKQLAHRYGVPKLVLFGFACRGDHHARSDYDFARSGDARRNSVRNSAMLLTTIWTRCIRLIWCLSANTPMPHCCKILHRTGLSCLIGYIIRFQNFSNAVECLQEEYRHIRNGRRQLSVTESFSVLSSPANWRGKPLVSSYLTKVYRVEQSESNDAQGVLVRPD